MTGKLENKVAVVTGGSAGIGLGIAKSFAEEGARVFIIGRREAELDKAASAIGGNATAIQGDTSKLGDLDRIYATIEGKARYIDVLAMNAGVYEFGTLGEITEEHFDKTFNTNVRGLLFTVQKALPLLRKGSSVISLARWFRSRGSRPVRCTMRPRPRYARSRARGSSISRGTISVSTF
jgi:NAD(P)-dependent dehydrogenase (short-subunit alcohol dehydrogenase family)